MSWVIKLNVYYWTAMTRGWCNVNLFSEISAWVGPITHNNYSHRQTTVSNAVGILLHCWHAECLIICWNRKDEIDHIIMDIISQGPSNAASKSAASTSSKPTAKPSATKTTNSRNKKSSVADDDSSDDADNNDAVSDEEMNDDKGSDSDDNMVMCPFMTSFVTNYLHDQ